MEWRDPANYAYTKDLPLWLWAWEFLRRSERYRGAWEAYSTAEAEGRQRDALYLHTYASFPFDLDWPIDPNLTALEIDGNPWLSIVGKYLLDDEPLPGEERDPSRWTRLTFDSSQPLAPQLSMAERFLRQQQEAWIESVESDEGIPVQIRPRQKPQRSKFVLYLQLLDASLAGESIGEMARRLFKTFGDPRKSASYALRTAKALADDGYRALLLTDDDPGRM